MEIRWSPLARTRVIEIAETIRWDKPGAAAQWVERVVAEVDSLPEMPRRGRVVPELDRQDLRELLIGNYRFIYRIEDDEIVVLTVRHGRQLLDHDELR